MIVVTGSSKGIGKGVAIRLAREGAKVVVNYRSDPAGAEEAVRVALPDDVECVPRPDPVLEGDLVRRAASQCEVDRAAEPSCGRGSAACTKQ